MPATASELHFSSASNGMLISPWEFDGGSFEPGCRYELVNGVLIVNPVPLREERDPNEELGRLLRNYQESHAKGALLDLTLSEETIRVGPHRRRVDRAIWAGLGRLPAKDEAPTIAIEFVSAGKRNQQRDYQIKRDEYRAAAVREYWIFDPFQATMTVYQFTREKVAERVLNRRQTYTSPILPGFKVPIGRLLELADRWAE